MSVKEVSKELPPYAIPPGSAAELISKIAPAGLLATAEAHDANDIAPTNLTISVVAT